MTLTPGAHLVPSDGACLMESVSVVAGLTWSDNPPCTHPLLAHVARLVNDMMSGAGRQQLVSRVARLATATSAAPETYPRIALACLTVAVERRPTPWVIILTRVTTNRLQGAAPSAGGRLREATYRWGPAWRAVEAAVAAVSSLAPVERDDALVRMLDASLSCVDPVPMMSATVHTRR